MIPTPDDLIDTFADFAMKFSDEDTLMYWGVFVLCAIPLVIYAIAWLLIGAIAVIAYLPFGILRHAIRILLSKRNAHP